jgi:cytochrome c oxidase subunit 2
MELHRYERIWLAGALALVVAFIATVVYGSVGAGVTMVEDDGGTIDADTVAEGSFEETSNFREPGVYRSGPNEYDVYVVARQFAFEPGSREPLRLPAGSRVTFHVTSADVVHGFNLVGTNVNVMVIPGQVATMTVEFDEETDYGMVCHEYCGAAHHTMAGTVEVVPASQYDAANETVEAALEHPADGSVGDTVEVTD